jgi:hypothetical protein
MIEIEGANTNSTFDQKRNVPDDASANVHAAMSNTFVCITAFLIICFHG